MLTNVTGRDRFSAPAGKTLPAALCSVLLLLGALGCKTSPSVSAGEEPGSGLRELRSLVIKLQGEIRTTTNAVTRLAAARPESSRQAFDRFEKTARHLEVASITARARVEALEKRGQAYFQEWNEEGAPGTSRRILTEAQYNQLRPHFDAILADAHQARERCRAFLESVRALRAASPGSNAPDLQAAAASVQTTGQTANGALERFLQTLASAESALTAARSDAREKTK